MGKGGKVLEQATLGKAQDVGGGDDEVIQHAHVHQRQCAFQGRGKQFIRARRGSVSRGMIVRKQDAGGVMRQGGFDNFTGVDTGLR